MKNTLKIAIRLTNSSNGRCVKTDHRMMVCFSMFIDYEKDNFGVLPLGFDLKRAICAKKKNCIIIIPKKNDTP